MNPRQLTALRASIGTLVVTFALQACSESDLAPREVPIDRADCASCGMMVSDATAAAQAVFAAEDPRFYDDVGCLVKDSAAWKGRVRAYAPGDGGQRWLEAERAFYGRPLGARTPMGFDFVAFETLAEAAEQDRDGRGRTWAELQAEFARGSS